MSDIGSLPAGSASVLILPNFSQFGAQLQSGIQQATNQAGAQLESGINASIGRSSGLIRTLGTSVMTLGGQAGPVGAIFTQVGGQIEAGMNRAAGTAESARGRIGGALEGIGAAFLGLGVIFEHFSGPLEKATADLETTITNTGHSVDEYADKLAAAEARGEKFGFTNADTREGLSRLAAAFQDPNKAIADSNVVMTIAAVKHESFADAAKQVAAGAAGNFRWAKQLGIDMTGVTVTTAQAEAATRKYESSVVSLADAQQRLSDFEARVAEREASAVEATAAAVEAANQRQADTKQNLIDLQGRIADQQDAYTLQVTDADQKIADAETNLADQRVALAQRVADAEQNLADLQISLADAVATAKDRANDDMRSSQQSIGDAQLHLQELQTAYALRGDPKLAAQVAQFDQMRAAQTAISRAKAKAQETAQNDAAAVAKAEAAQTKGLAGGQRQVSDAERAQDRGLTAADKQLDAAVDARRKVDVDHAKQLVAQTHELRVATEAVGKAEDALAKAREKAATAGSMTLSERQQEAKLAEEVGKKQSAMDEAKAKADEDNSAVADNARKLELLLAEVDKRYGGISEARARTWSGQLKRMITELEDFMGRAGEKLAKPLMEAGPLAFIGGALLRRGGSKAAGSAAGAAAGAAAGVAEVGAGAAGAAEGGAIGLAGAESLGGLGAIAAGPVALVTAALVGAGVALWQLYEHSTVFHKFVDDAWQVTQKVVKGVWEDVLQPVFGFIGDHWRGLIEILAPGFYLIADNWRLIASGAKIMWDDVKPILGFFVDLGVAVVVDWFKTLWHVGEDAFNGVAKIVKWAWDEVLQPVFSKIGDHLGEGSVIRTALHSLGGAWDTVWKGMSSVVSSVWGDIEGFVSAGLGTIGTIVGKVLGIVATVAEHIPGAGDVAGVLRDAQHSVQDWGKGSAPKAAPSEQMAQGGGLGWTPIGAGFVTSKETAIVHEGGPHEEYVIPTDPAHRGNARKLYGQLGPKLMAGGGWLSDIIGGAENVVGGVTDWVGDIARKGAGNVVSAAWPKLPVGDNLLSLVPGGVNALREAVIGYIKGAGAKKSGAGTGADVGGTGWQQLDNFLTALGIGHIRTSDFRKGDPGYHGKGLAADFVGSDGTEGGMVAIFNAFHDVAGQMAELIHNPSGGVKNGADVDPSFWGSATWDGHRDHVHAAIEASTRLRGASGASASDGGDATSWINAALEIDGKPKDWFQGVYDRMMQESGGRNIPQEIHDINTDQGNPAFGPMQIIEPTFDAYKAPGHGDWHNPVDSTAASLNYIADLYGSPYNLPSGGYATGGVLANWAGVMDSGGTFRPGMNVAYNGTGADEHLSPVSGYDEVKLADAIVDALASRPLLVSAHSASVAFEDRRRAYTR